MKKRKPTQADLRAMNKGRLTTTYPPDGGPAKIRPSRARKIRSDIGGTRPTIQSPPVEEDQRGGAHEIARKRLT
jgi:hypothetical protein